MATKLLAMYTLPLVPAHVFVASDFDTALEHPHRKHFRLPPCAEGAELLRTFMNISIESPPEMEVDMLPFLAKYCGWMETKEYPQHTIEALKYAMWLFRNYKPWIESEFYKTFCLYADCEVAYHGESLFAQEFCEFSQHLEEQS